MKKDEDFGDVEAPDSSDSDDICTDDDKCGYVCPNYECQAEGSYFNMSACMCFYEDQCDIECPEGETLDPTQYCSCVPDGLIDDLMETIDGWIGSGSLIGLSMAATTLVGVSLM